MKRLSSITWRLAAAAFFVLIGSSASAQTPLEFRAKYGEPQMTQIKNRRVEVQRYLVRPNIQMTVRFTNQGQACEAEIEPVPSSTPTVITVEHAPEGDYMSTAEVIEVINEVVPVAQRGKRIGGGSMNGGDPDMKLHHPGCYGMTFASYEKVSFSSSSWCNGGTFSATIHFGKTSCKGESITIKKKKPSP